MDIMRIFHKEYRKPFIGSLTGVDPPMEAVRRFVPIDLTRENVDDSTRPVILVFNHQCIPAEDYRQPIMRIAMPGHGLAWFEGEAPHKRCAAMK